MTDTENKIVIAALYQFTPLDDLPALKAHLQEALETAGIMGTLLIAREGINGTIGGTRQAIDAALQTLRALPGLAGLPHKESFTCDMPFYRLKVRIKAEIVTMGVPDIDPTETVGTYVAPGDWNDLISREDVVVIDARNDYEVAIGTFDRAIDPKTASFSELPGWLDARADLKSKPKVAMFCTGGIRCEKATAYLKARGFDEVYHLDGGILKYLERVPPEDSLWRGECFVFDQRVAVKHGLEQGSYELCFGCRMPVSAQDKQSPEYEPGICCPACHDTLDETRRLRLRNRQEQVRRAKARGTAHFGPQKVK